MYMNKILITFFTVLFCLSSSSSWSEIIKDLIKKNGIYYKKLSEVPFTGKIAGKEQGIIKNGKREGFWVNYHINGQLKSKGNFKNSKKEGSWVSYYDNGSLNYKVYFKNGKKIND